MKKLFIILLFSVGMGIAQGQKYANREFTLFNYNISIEESLREKIKGAEKSLNTNGRYEEKGQEKLIGCIKDLMYSKFTQKATNELLYFFLPVNSFQKKFKYDHYNYPKGSITRAIKYGSSKYYYKLDISIKEGETNKKKEEEEEQEDDKKEKKEEKIVPIVKFTFTIYNSKGYVPIKKIEGFGKDSLPSDPSILYGLTPNNKATKGDSLNLVHLLDIAVDQVIQQLK